MNASYQVKSLNNKTLSLDKIGIVYDSEREKSTNVADKLEKVLKKYGFYSIKKQIAPSKGKYIEEFEKDVDLAVVIGGDGAFLGAARLYSKLDIPLLGINVGRLGFLAQLNPEDIEEGVRKLIDGRFKIEERLMLKAFSETESPEKQYSALNDIIIKGGEISRAVQLFLYIDGKHVCDYIADGLIISTPTGSTAYTLSAGGPVVVPEMKAIVIVPICPHALTTRPIVIPASEKITVKIKTDSDLIYLTADGQENVKLQSESSINIEQYEHKAKLILPEKENNGFYSILREKLHWGVSPIC